MNVSWRTARSLAESIDVRKGRGGGGLGSSRIFDECIRGVITKPQHARVVVMPTYVKQLLEVFDKTMAQFESLFNAP